MKKQDILTQLAKRWDKFEGLDSVNRARIKWVDEYFSCPMCNATYRSYLSPYNNGLVCAETNLKLHMKNSYHYGKIVSYSERKDLIENSSQMKDLQFQIDLLTNKISQSDTLITNLVNKLVKEKISALNKEQTSYLVSSEEQLEKSIKESLSYEMDRLQNKMVATYPQLKGLLNPASLKSEIRNILNFLVFGQEADSTKKSVPLKELLMEDIDFKIRSEIGGRLGIKIDLYTKEALNNIDLQEVLNEIVEDKLKNDFEDIMKKVYSKVSSSTHKRFTREIHRISQMKTSTVTELHESFVPIDNEVKLLEQIEPVIPHTICPFCESEECQAGKEMCRECELIYDNR